MTDSFSAYPFVPDAPANGAFAVTPDDNANLPNTARALYIGGAGNVAIVTRDGSATTFENVPAGTTLRITVSQVKATGTTATAIVGLY